MKMEMVLFIEVQFRLKKIEVLMSLWCGMFFQGEEEGAID